MDDPVWVGTGPPPDLHHECEVVLPLAAYDANLGMRTRGELRRQLRLDLPRSVVLLDGVRTRDASRVMSRVSHPRLCTQAVLAPPVEWLARQGRIVHEEPRSSWPVVVEVTGAGRVVDVRKRLALWSEDDASHVLHLGLHADANSDVAVVSIHIEAARSE